MITADPKSPLGYWCKLVADMEPGQCLSVDMRELQVDISSYEHNGATFTPADRVLGNIVGSGFTHSYTIEPMNRTVTFRRHVEDGRRTHEDPDRRKAEWGYDDIKARALRL